MQTGLFQALIRSEGYRRIHIYQPVEWDRIGDFFHDWFNDLPSSENPDPRQNHTELSEQEGSSLKPPRGHFVHRKGRCGEQVFTESVPLFLIIPYYAGLRYETSADRWISHLKCLFIGDFPLVYLIPGRQFSQNVGISMFCRLWKPSLHVGEKLELAIRFCHLQFDHHLHHLQKCSHVGDQLLWVPTKTSTMSFTQEFTCKWSTSI